MKRDFEEAKSIRQNTRFLNGYISRSNIPFGWFVTISFDENEYHYNLKRIQRSEIRHFHREIYKAATKYTNRRWLSQPDQRPSIFSIIEDRDTYGNSVFPHIHAMITVDKEHEDAYFDKLEFYIKKYGSRFLHTIPNSVREPIYDKNGLMDYLCKNIDYNFQIDSDMIIEGKIRTQHSN